MLEKRANKRVPFRNIVRYGLENPPVKISYVTDLSETGLFIKTCKVYRPDTKLYLTVEVNGKLHNGEGVVTWAKKVPQNLMKIIKGGMGIRFTRIDETLKNLCRDKKGIDEDKDEMFKVRDVIA
jgi:Tfp pilus assembly protein PilZ